VPTLASAALRTKHVRAELLVSGVGRSFLGAPSDATRPASRQAWERTVAFIDQTIGDQPRWRGVVAGGGRQRRGEEACLETGRRMGRPGGPRRPCPPARPIE
jgi:hypothetical protein